LSTLVADMESTTLINLEDDGGGASSAAIDQSMSADDFDSFLSAVTSGPASNTFATPSVIATPNITTATQLTTNGKYTQHITNQVT